MLGDKAASIEAAFLRPGMDRQKIAPCIFCTSHIHVGRMQQGAKDGGAANVQDVHRVSFVTNIAAGNNKERVSVSLW